MSELNARAADSIGNASQEASLSPQAAGLSVILEESSEQAASGSGCQDRLGSDIHYGTSSNKITYKELLLKLQEAFPGSRSAQDEVLIKFGDEDGDRVPIANTAALALSCAWHSSWTEVLSLWSKRKQR